MSANDLRTVRESLIRIIKYYFQKEVNIKEVTMIISYLASIKNDKIVLEVLCMLTSLMEAKVCKDQLFLLMYEPHMAELLYALFVDKSYGNYVHSALLKVSF
jgi:neurobeachin-like protein 1/2